MGETSAAAAAEAAQQRRQRTSGDAVFTTNRGPRNCDVKRPCKGHLSQHKELNYVHMQSLPPRPEDTHPTNPLIGGAHANPPTGRHGGPVACRRQAGATQRHRTQTGFFGGGLLGSKRGHPVLKSDRHAPNFSGQIGPEKTEVWVPSTEPVEPKFHTWPSCGTHTVPERQKSHQRAQGGGKPAQNKRPEFPPARRQRKSDKQDASRRPPQNPKTTEAGPPKTGEGAYHETGPSLVGRLGSVLKNVTTLRHPKAPPGV